MTQLPLSAGPLQEAFAALTKDLVGPDGPAISTMRNYRFAIVQYEPDQEFKLREHVNDLTKALKTSGWVVLPIDLQKLLFERIAAAGERWAGRVARMEREMEAMGPGRGLNYLKSKLETLIEGADGIAADVCRHIDEHLAAHPDVADRTVALIGRAGALYPFFRSSALLRHVDGKTHNVPVVLLYPGTREGSTALSFMGKLAPDSDYRPRIYP